MTLELIGKGLLIGLIFGVPAGAIGTLTIQRTIDGGFLYGFLTGLGSSAADVIYAIAGVSGMTFITVFLQKNETLCCVCGALLIIFYGIVVILKKDKKDANIKINNKTLISGFASAFLIAIMNPSTILSFLVAFSTFGLIEKYSVEEGTQIILGVLMGTGLWWCILSLIVSMLREKITDKVYLLMNRILGTLLIVFGAVMILQRKMQL